MFSPEYLFDIPHFDVFDTIKGNGINVQMLISVRVIIVKI
jgi:hypothetical protein